MYKNYDPETLKLFPIGSRVECGNKHRGRLVGYFTGVGPNNHDGESDLFGVIALDEEYRVVENKAHIAMLVVHHNNLDLCEEKPKDFIGDFERNQIEGIIND